MTDSGRGITVSLHDTMIAHLREHTEGTTPEELAALFLKLKNPPRSMAAAAIRAILSTDSRCYCDDSGKWHAREAAKTAQSDSVLAALPWSALFCRTDPSGRQLLYCALYDLYPDRKRVAGGWFIDPSSLQAEDRGLLVDAVEPESAAPTPYELLETIVRLCYSRFPVLLSSLDRRALSFAASRAGLFLSDNSMLVGELAKAAGTALVRPLTPASLEKAVLGVETESPDPVRQGERFAACVEELIEQLSRRGIESLSDLEAALQHDRSHFFSGKDFTAETLLAQPSCPGVYGFKNAGGAWLYIGKSSNLRRRLSGYFSDTDESPGKLRRLLAESHTLVTQPYGSELECLIYEYRLIKKYAPLLNNKTDVHERRGTYKPLHDCIVLLPHVEADNIVSLWLREGQKILLRTISGDPGDDRTLPDELVSFFFSTGTPPASSDFPELEIAVRWIRHALDRLPVIPVAGMADAGEVAEALKSACLEFRERMVASAGTPGNKEYGFRQV